MQYECFDSVAGLYLYEVVEKDSAIVEILIKVFV